jgi:parallel beta-helix repeat protein
MCSIYATLVQFRRRLLGQSPRILGFETAVRGRRSLDVMRRRCCRRLAVASLPITVQLLSYGLAPRLPGFRRPVEPAASVSSFAKGTDVRGIPSPRACVWSRALAPVLLSLVSSECSSDRITSVAPAETVVIHPGESIQQAVTAHPPGTSFLIKAGVYRMQSVVVKLGDKFAGEPGTILSGARVLTQFGREGTYWVVTGQTQENPRFGPNPYGSEVCWDGSDGKHPDSRGCIYPEDLFLDNRPLRHVTTLAAVQPGSWFFDYQADKIYFVDDPTGHVVEVGVTALAITGDATHGVVVQGLTIEKYANAAQRAVVEFRNSNSVVIRDNEIRWCHGTGAAITTGASGVISGNFIHDNGELGVGSFGSSDLLVAGNELARNNYAGYNSTWEAGGAKFVRTTGLVVRGNNVHDNLGKGIWTDTDDIRSLIDSNVVTGNTDHGIFREAGYAAMVRDNTVVNNGWHGIIIDSSPDVEVSGNTVRNNGWNWPSPLAQIGGRDTRDGASGKYGPSLVRNLWVHDNTVEGAVGAGLVGSDSIFASQSNNRFDRNSYRLSSQLPFQWRGALVTNQVWQAAGQDLHGSFTW